MNGKLVSHLLDTSGSQGIELGLQLVIVVSETFMLESNEALKLDSQLAVEDKSIDFSFDLNGSYVEFRAIELSMIEELILVILAFDLLLLLVIISLDI